MAKPVPIGTRVEKEFTVEHEQTLNHYDKRLPPVLSTPNMIGWMEFCCFLATEPYQDDGEITVGTAIHVTHRAPTGIGGKVLASAELERIDGRFHIFKVQAKENGRVIGDGHVHRAFVHVPTFMAKHKVGK